MTTSTFVAQEVQPRTWSIIHWRAASTSVPPPPKSCAGPASAGETSAALPVRYLVTLACASAAGRRSASRSNAPQPTLRGAPGAGGRVGVVGGGGGGGVVGGGGGGGRGGGGGGGVEGGGGWG